MSTDKLDANDILEITNLIHKYFQCIDFEEPEKFADLFGKDAIFSFPFRKLKIEGRDNFVGLCKNLHSKFPTATHWEGNVVIENHSTDQIKRASNTSYWKAIRDGVIISLGFHFDKFECRDGKWVFVERIVELKWSLETGNIKAE